MEYFKKYLTIKKRIMVGMIVLSSTISCYSQIDNEYQESNFKSSEELSYNPKNEVFLISSVMISNKYMVFDKLPNKSSYSISVDYEKNILTIKMGKTSETFTIQKDDDEYYWGDMPQYYLVKGYLFNKKNEKSSFIVESGASGSITLTIDKNMKNRADVYRAGLQNR